MKQKTTEEKKGCPCFWGNTAVWEYRGIIYTIVQKKISGENDKKYVNIWI